MLFSSFPTQLEKRSIHPLLEFPHFSLMAIWFVVPANDWILLVIVNNYRAIQLSLNVYSHWPSATGDTGNHLHIMKVFLNFGSFHLSKFSLWFFLLLSLVYSGTSSIPRCFPSFKIWVFYPVFTKINAICSCGLI